MKVGDKIKDNDPRIPYERVLYIVETTKTHIIATPGKCQRVVRIRKDRIYTDGKPRRSGFTLLAIIALALMLAGCTPFGFNPMSYEELSLPLAEAWTRTAAFEYQDETVDAWKSPREFERDGGGDCEDFALYFAYLLGEDATIILYHYSPGISHAVVRYYGEYLEPGICGEYLTIDESEIFARIPYYLAMAWYTDHGTKGL